MRVLMTGATGFIGRALLLRLRREGHAVTALARSPARARTLLGAEAAIVDAGRGRDALVDAVENADAVVNLAGESIGGGRWTRARRQRIVDSRVGVTHALVEAMAAARRRPQVLVSASAAGYYGDRDDEALDETSGAGTGFLAELCRDWEREAMRAEQL